MHGKRKEKCRQMHFRHAVIHKVHITNCGEVIQWEQFPSALLELKYQQAIKENINLLYSPKWAVKFCSHTSKQPKTQVSSYPLLLGHFQDSEIVILNYFVGGFLVLLFQTDKLEENILLHHPSSRCSKHVVTDSPAVPERFRTRSLLAFSPEGCTALAHWDATEASFWTLKRHYCDFWGRFTCLLGSIGIRYKAQRRQGGRGEK